MRHKLNRCLEKMALRDKISEMLPALHISNMDLIKKLYMQTIA